MKGIKNTYFKNTVLPVTKSDKYLSYMLYVYGACCRHLFIYCGSWSKENYYVVIFSLWSGTGLKMSEKAADVKRKTERSSENFDEDNF